jgi:hypothetical protein
MLPVSTNRKCSSRAGGRIRGAAASRSRSNALENLCASRPYHAAIRSDVCRDPPCGDRRGADKAPGPGRGHAAIWRPRPRRLECDPRTSNASYQVIGNSRTCARRGIDENPGEISSCRFGPQNLQNRATLTLPDGGYQALGGRRSSGCDKKKKNGDDTVHVHSPSGWCLHGVFYHERIAATIKQKRVSALPSTTHWRRWPVPGWGMTLTAKRPSCSAAPPQTVHSPDAAMSSGLLLTV